MPNGKTVRFFHVGKGRASPRKAFAFPNPEADAIGSRQQSLFRRIAPYESPYLHHACRTVFPVRFFHVGGCIYSIRNYNALKQLSHFNVQLLCLISIRNYNALKLYASERQRYQSLISIRNYNALKRMTRAVGILTCLISIRNYNALKRNICLLLNIASLISIRNYNALKRITGSCKKVCRLVSIRNYNALNPQTEGQATVLSIPVISHGSYKIISEKSSSIKIFFSENNFPSLCTLSTKIKPILFLNAQRYIISSSSLLT